MGLFKKKKKEDEESEEDPSEEEETPDSAPSGDAGGGIALAKMSAKVDSLVDMRKSYSERFTMISEQIGELRGMIMDASKQIQTQEIQSTKTIELVKAVQPDKFSSMLRKQEGAIEAIKAALESKDAVMKDITEDMKKMRKQMSFYRGIEQVIKLNEEIKKDMFSIKKVQAIVEQHSDKVESMFVDLQKKYGDIDSLTKSVHDVEDMLKKVKSDIDKNRLEIDKKVPTTKHADLVKKFDFFATNAHIAKLETFTETIDTFQSKNNETLQSIEKVKEETQKLQERFQVANIDHLTTDVARLNNLIALIDNDMKQTKDIVNMHAKDKANTQDVIELVAELKKEEELQHKTDEETKKLREQFEEMNNKKVSKKDFEEFEEKSSKQKELLIRADEKVSRIGMVVEQMEKDHNKLIGMLAKTQKELDQIKTRAPPTPSRTAPRATRKATPKNQLSPLKLSDGDTLYSIDDIQQAVRQMSPTTFAQYVSKDSNVFADWIEKQLKIKALAKVLRTKLYRDEFLHMLEAYKHVVR